jgi:hypothetical protein
MLSKKANWMSTRISDINTAVDLIDSYVEDDTEALARDVSRSLVDRRDTLRARHKKTLDAIHKLNLPEKKNG